MRVKWCVFYLNSKITKTSKTNMKECTYHNFVGSLIPVIYILLELWSL